MLRIWSTENDDIGVIVNGVERLRADGPNTFHVFEYCHIKEGIDFCGVPLEQW